MKLDKYQEEILKHIIDNGETNRAASNSDNKFLRFSNAQTPSGFMYSDCIKILKELKCFGLLDLISTQSGSMAILTIRGMNYLIDKEETMSKSEVKSALTPSEIRISIQEIQKRARAIYNQEIDANVNSKETGTTFLIRYINFIDSNEVIKSILSEFDKTPCLHEEFVKFSSIEHAPYNVAPITNFITPVEPDKEISYILMAIHYLKEQNLKALFYDGGNKKTNANIRAGLKMLIEPLTQYIVENLKSKFDEMEESEIESLPLIVQGDVIYGNKNQAGRDINSKTTVKTKNVFKIIKNQKQGFVLGIISGIITGLSVWGITELIRFLIGS